jgi:hypothetical protein
MVEYSLTTMGRVFIEPIEMLYAWEAKNDDASSKLRRRRKKHTAIHVRSVRTSGDRDTTRSQLESRNAKPRWSGSVLRMMPRHKDSTSKDGQP